MKGDVWPLPRWQEHTEKSKAQGWLVVPPPHDVMEAEFCVPSGQAHGSALLRLQNVCHTAAKMGTEIHTFPVITFARALHFWECMFHGSFAKNYEILVHIQGICSHF